MHRRYWIHLVLVAVMLTSVWPIRSLADCTGIDYESSIDQGWETHSFFIGGTSTPSLVTLTIENVANLTAVEVYDGTMWTRIHADTIVDAIAVRHTIDGSASISYAFGECGDVVVLLWDE